MSLLDVGPDISRRISTWRFDLVDFTLTNAREVLVDRLDVPSIRVDTSRPTKRTLEGIRLPPTSSEQVDIVRDRLRVTMLTEDDEQHPMGVFIFADRIRGRLTSGVDFSDASLSDQCLIVDQQIGKSITVRPGELITTGIQRLLDPLPITYTLEPDGAVVTPEQEAITWDAGRNRLGAVNELAAMLGYHELYFDNLGIGRLGPMPNPDAVAPETVLSHPVGTYLGSLSSSNNLLELPNRFVVVNNGATQTAVSGTYDLPASAPHSAANRGFVVPKVLSLQGIETPLQARIAAQAEARKWRYAFETLEFETPPDPRHDHYRVMSVDNERFLEVAWACPLEEGAKMRHQVRRTYEEGESPL